MHKGEEGKKNKHSQNIILNTDWIGDIYHSFPHQLDGQVCVLKCVNGLWAPQQRISNFIYLFFKIQQTD